MIKEIVVSPIFDPDISNNLEVSHIWKQVYHPEEITDEIRKSHPILYKYTIKFDYLCPVQSCGEIEEF